jgi:hypothetical protein
MGRHLGKYMSQVVSFLHHELMLILFFLVHPDLKPTAILELQEFIMELLEFIMLSFTLECNFIAYAISCTSHWASGS